MQENETPQEPKPYPTAKIGEKEVVVIRKRQIKNIARRSGKTVEEIRGMMAWGRVAVDGGKVKVKYTVVAE